MYVADTTIPGWVTDLHINIIAQLSKHLSDTLSNPCFLDIGVLAGRVTWAMADNSPNGHTHGVTIRKQKRVHQELNLDKPGPNWVVGDLDLWPIEQMNLTQAALLVAKIKDNYKNVSMYVDGSDVFFDQNTDTFDLVFVDGDHSYEQSRRDIVNSLERLRPNGLVLVDDYDTHQGVINSVRSVVREYGCKLSSFPFKSENIAILYKDDTDEIRRRLEILG